MCKECEFYQQCGKAGRICREILRSGDFGRMVERFDDRTRDCDLFVPVERRRYA